MPDIKAVGLITLLVIVEALQLLAIVAHLYSFIPIHWNVPIPPGLEPERESFLYIIFLFIAVLLTVGLTKFFYKLLTAENVQRRFLKYLYVEAGWLFLMLFAFFKWVTYKYPFYNILPLEQGNWVYPLFYGVVALSFLSKIFWPEVDRFSDKCCKMWNERAFPKGFDPCVYVLVTVLMIAVLYPNASLAVQVIATWSKFSQWQGFGLTKFLITRGFSTEHIVLILFYMNMALLTMILIAAHRYLRSFWLAAMVILLVIQMTFFHYGMEAICWNYPQNTLINPSIDLAFLKDAAHPPMFMALRVRQFLSFFMGYGIVVFYVFTLLNAWGKDKVAVVLSLWGLLTYTRYIGHPDVFAYGAVCWPAIILLAGWVRMLGERFFPKNTRPIYAALALAALFLLLTNRVFVTYPHFWVNHVP